MCKEFLPISSDGYSDASWDTFVRVGACVVES